nr:immunoglobulin light chain junction region [Mus musculus]NSL97314.1 immunoglobulin light chain junction region [Mus musculus]NSL97899.1 immunoglobulin light chain junction region [Mus musculus]NSL97983.1 immunoglobulin light chain junction region [Mus musculus]NSL98766.1 immunoglobulin light chain junction region [Mus musculus]
CQNVLSTPYTF